MPAQPNLELKAAIKKSGANVQKYIARLEEENFKLHDQIAELKADNLSKNHEIKALTKQLGKHGNIPDLGDRLRRANERQMNEDAINLTDEVLKEKMLKLGWRIEKVTR